MVWCKGQRAENQQVQRALRKIHPSFYIHEMHSPVASTGDDTASLLEAQGEVLSKGTRSGGEEKTRKRLPFLLRASAAGALEFAHEAGEGLNGRRFDGVVERDAHATDGAVAGSTAESGSLGFFGELFFHGFVTTGDAEDDIHLRARTVFDGAAVKAAAGFDRLVKHRGLGVVALLDGC